MGEQKAGTARFDSLVEESGLPEMATLWVDPEKDQEFMRIVKADRVVTVCQHNIGTKKDFGLVGFSKEKKRSQPRKPGG